MQEKYSPVPEHYSTLVHDLINKLLEKDPNKRPSIENILHIPEIAIEVTKLKIKYPHIYTNNSTLTLSTEIKSPTSDDPFQLKPRSISSGDHKVLIDNGPLPLGRVSSKSSTFAHHHNQKQMQIETAHDEEGKVETSNKISDVFEINFLYP